MKTENIGPKFWAGWLATGLAFEAAALHMKRNDLTGSYATRAGAHTHTPWGRTAFVLGWSAFSVWFVPHIALGVNDVTRAIEEKLS